MSREGRLFIESSRFPVALVSAASAKEKQGGGRPPFWEMVFWWTRKPLASARAAIAGCLLPEDIDVDEFVKALRLDEKVAHRHDPVIPEQGRQYFSAEEMVEYEVVNRRLLRSGIQPYRLRVSGHYYPYEIYKILKTIRPKQVIPVHREHPELMKVGGR
jgi:hypothetical protein